MKLSPHLIKLERHVAARDYAGYSKFDALNSRVLELCFGRSALTRLLVVQMINRVPLPLRTLFGVRKERNPKGVANFIKGYCALAEVTGDRTWGDKAVGLGEWLLRNHSGARGAFKGKGMGWGYNFPWQSPGFHAPRHAPNCIVTIFCAEALLDIHRLTGEAKWLEAARGASRFLLDDLPVLEETDRLKCIGYVTEDLSWRVVNINAVAAGFLGKLAAVLGDAKLGEQAKKMVHWVISVRSPESTWNYTEPKSQSGIGPDNYHTGGILDGILDYMRECGDFTHREAYLESLNLYRDRFFTTEAAPRWRLNRDYPQDIHGAAQGILTFSKASRLDPTYLSVADGILKWAVDNMQDPSGFFYYQKRRFYTWRLELMRWNNSWMLWAMADLERTRVALELPDRGRQANRKR